MTAITPQHEGRLFGCPIYLERYRTQLPGYPPGDSGNGSLYIRPKALCVIFSNDCGWEHVSASRRADTPDWKTMCWLKDQFWPPQATVVQYHPPASEYVNNHEFCLHLWRPIAVELPRPPSIMVGVRPPARR